MMNGHLLNRICEFYLEEKFSKQEKLSRLKSNFDKKDNDQSGILINLLPIPSTSLPKTGIFPLLEPSVSITTSQFAALPLDFKWNQKMEYQLPDGKKVFSIINLIVKVISSLLSDDA